MKYWYVEFTNNNGEQRWSTCQGDSKQDVEYTLSIYGLTATLVEEIHPEFK